MFKITTFVIFLFLIFSCKSKVEKIKPTVESISESIYASGIIKSKNQYQAFATVNGIIENIFVLPKIKTIIDHKDKFFLPPFEIRGENQPII